MEEEARWNLLSFTLSFLQGFFFTESQRPKSSKRPKSKNDLGIMLRLACKNFCHKKAFLAVCCERNHAIANLVYLPLEGRCSNFPYKNLCSTKFNVIIIKENLAKNCFFPPSWITIFKDTIKIYFRKYIKII